MAYKIYAVTLVAIAFLAGYTGIQVGHHEGRLEMYREIIQSILVSPPDYEESKYAIRYHRFEGGYDVMCDSRTTANKGGSVGTLIAQRVTFPVVP